MVVGGQAIIFVSLVWVVGTYAALFRGCFFLVYKYRIIARFCFGGGEIDFDTQLNVLGPSVMLDSCLTRVTGVSTCQPATLRP